MQIYKLFLNQPNIFIFYFRINGAGASELPHINGAGASELPHINGAGASELPHINGARVSELPHINGAGASELPQDTEWLDATQHLNSREIFSYPQDSGKGNIAMEHLAP